MILQGARPFDSLQVADLGDIDINFFHLPHACEDITKGYREIIKNGCKTLTMGGDHTVTFPILQAIKV